MSIQTKNYPQFYYVLSQTVDFDETNFSKMIFLYHTIGPVGLVRSITIMRFFYALFLLGVLWGDDMNKIK